MCVELLDINFFFNLNVLIYHTCTYIILCDMREWINLNQYLKVDKNKLIQYVFV